MRPIPLTRILDSGKREMVAVNPERIAYLASNSWNGGSYVTFDYELGITVAESMPEIISRLAANRAGKAFDQLEVGTP